jgi:hypothetical protein
MQRLIIILFYILLLNINILGSDYINDAKDKARITQIIAETMRSENYLTKNIHSEFWSILDKHINMNDEKLKKLRLLTTGSIINYLFYFYQDMLISIDQKRIYKSKDRENLEQFLLNEGVLYNWRIEQNEKYIKKAISGKAVKTKNGDVIFTKNIIYRALKNLDTLDKRMNTLFTRPQKKH